MIERKLLPPAMTVRVKFSKTGYAKFISHLDLQRTMMRIMRRASLPLWLTQGFNPHPYVNFCSPLSIGIEGENEYMDFKVSEILPFEEIKERLSANMPTGFEILDVYQANREYKEVQFASYRLELGVKKEKVEEFIALPEIKVIKKTKKSEKEIDLKELATFSDLKENGEGSIITITLPNSQELSVNPHLFINALLSWAETPDAPFRTVRTAFLDGNKKKF